MVAINLHGVNFAENCQHQSNFADNFGQDANCVTCGFFSSFLETNKPSIGYLQELIFIVVGIGLAL